MACWAWAPSLKYIGALSKDKPTTRKKVLIKGHFLKPSRTSKKKLGLQIKLQRFDDAHNTHVTTLCIIFLLPMDHIRSVLCFLPSMLLFSTLLFIWWCLTACTHRLWLIPSFKLHISGEIGNNPYPCLINTYGQTVLVVCINWCRGRG
jgi:hypothetical protein